MSSDWKARIDEMVAIRRAIAEADVRGLWEHRLPAVGATSEQIERVEQSLGFGLDQSYRDFLRHANGWPAFYQAVDLLGTDGLAAGSLAEAGSQRLSDLESSALDQAGVNAGCLLPIAISRTDLDLFVLATPAAPRPGEVLWFAGYLVDRFATFEEHFLAMEDYNRLEVQTLKASSS